MLDYNLLKQNRLNFIRESKKNGISIFAGTVLCQGLLIESIFKTYLRTFSPFYLGRILLQKEKRRFIYPANKLRKYIKTNYKDSFKKIPLSFIRNEDCVDYISMGMLSFSSLDKNIEIIKNPIEKKITDKVSRWARKNCQIKL